MQSRQAQEKKMAIAMRKRGMSIRNIETSLSIPRSTLSGWFKTVQITKQQKEKLKKRWKAGLVKARKLAVLVHNEGKRKRVEKAKQEALDTLQNIAVSDKNILDLALAMLYWGEGFKRESVLGIGNSDPMVLRFFLAVLSKNYDIDKDSITCQLHLRADQDREEMIEYWSKALGVKKANFKYVYLDKRTVGSKTYDHYKGVCVLSTNNVAIQRKLVYLSKVFCERIIARDP